MTSISNPSEGGTASGRIALVHHFKAHASDSTQLIWLEASCCSFDHRRTGRHLGCDRMCSPSTANLHACCTDSRSGAGNKKSVASCRASFEVIVVKPEKGTSTLNSWMQTAADTKATETQVSHSYQSSPSSCSHIQEGPTHNLQARL